MAASIARKKALGIGITDAVAVLFILAVPALSHLTSVPFYLLDPMRLAVLGALLASRSRVNGLVLAVALPLVSFAISGHPVFRYSKRAAQRRKARREDKRPAGHQPPHDR